MLKIQCAQCGAILKAKDTTTTPFHNFADGVKYQDYAVTCNKCGGIVVYDRMVKKAQANKENALAKLAQKTGKSIAQVKAEGGYNDIMKKVGKRAKEIAASYKENPKVKYKDLNQAINELPPNEKCIVLAHEDKENMAILTAKTPKQVDHISPQSILLLTQSWIECAIADNDEEFFQSEFGKQIADTYNTALTIHTHTDYEVTAELLLEKMRKNAIKIKGEKEDV